MRASLAMTFAAAASAATYTRTNPGTLPGTYTIDDGSGTLEYCEDTPDWSWNWMNPEPPDGRRVLNRVLNPWTVTCDNYAIPGATLNPAKGSGQTDAFCEDGAPTGRGARMGPSVNYPDLHCCACGGGTISAAPTPSSTGDPVTTFHGREIRYWLSMEHFTPVLEQGPFVLSQLAGPANPPPGLEDHKGDWVVAAEVAMAGMDAIRIETVDPTTLLAPPNATAAPPAADALTTLRLSAGGKRLMALGEHALALDTTLAARRVPARKIGRGWVEQVEITAKGLHLRITSSKANKFADEALQVLGLHLDLEILTIDESAVRGALPEMWGLLPMSEATKRLLDQPTDRAPAGA